MNSTIAETKADPTSRQDAAKPEFRLYAGIAAFLLIVVVMSVAGPRVLHGSAVHSSAPLPPVVIVSQPLQREIHGRIQLLGQFAAVDQVELRPQVGGTLTYIGFKDGKIVKKGDLLFIVDPTPYQIKLDQGTAQVASARARLEFARTELARAQTLVKTDAGTVENVEQRSAEERSAQASLEQAEAFVRDAKFDLNHTHVYAPFTGRIGTHLVSVGNLVLGNRGGGSVTTLLATMVSLDPIYLNFDMSEADYLRFEQERVSRKGGSLAEKVEIALSDDDRFSRHGTLNFIDNILDRSSGTIHARATVPNSDLFLTPGAFGRVRVDLSEPKEVLLVPDAAVTADQTDRMILVVGQEGLVKAKKVQAGGIRYGLRVIYSGLNVTDQVIIGGQPVTPNARVSAKNGSIALGSDEGQD